MPPGLRMADVGDILSGGDIYAVSVLHFVPFDL